MVKGRKRSLIGMTMLGKTELSGDLAQSFTVIIDIKMKAGKPNFSPKGYP